ncbi:MAG: hypothetical protein R6U56_08045 [Opitutales bacterium]
MLIKTRTQKILFTATGLVFPALSVFGETWRYEATTTWESKYVENGRNELHEGGIFTMEAIAAYEGFSLGAWSVLADSVDYKELQLTAAYAATLKGIELVGGWTHLEFDPDSADDDELFLEISPGSLAGFELSAALVYSFEADGSFLELRLGHPLAFFEERLTVEPYLQENFDFGYRTAAHDGLSNLEAGIDLSFALNERFNIVAFLAHSWAQEDVEREGLGDVSWAGFGLGARF